MAASAYNIVLSNGQTLSVWQLSSQAVNTSPAATFLGAAATTTLTTDFSPMSDCVISDVVVAAALTAGGFEVYNVSDGVRSGRGINNLEAYLNTNTTRNPPRIGFRADKIYRLVQTVAGNA